MVIGCRLVRHIDNYIKYSLDFLRPIKTAEAFEAVDWLADLSQQTWLQLDGAKTRGRGDPFSPCLTFCGLH